MSAPADCKPPSADAMRKREVAKTYIIALVFAIVGTVGIAFLALGFKQVANAVAYNPATDFDVVPGGCTVLTATKHDDYKYGKPSVKWDRYTYTIAKTSMLPVAVATGIDDTRFRGGAPPGTAFVVGANTTCWQKAAGVELAFLQGFYGCGNDECLTIADPQVTKNGNLDDMGLWLGLGAGEFTIGLCGAVIMLCGARRARRTASKVNMATDGGK